MVLGSARSSRPRARHIVFRGGTEYAHGGLTVQEALIPSLTVAVKANGHLRRLLLKELKWAGLRLNVVLHGAEGLTVDIRSKVADAGSSFATSATIALGNGQKTSILVADDGALQKAAFLVLVDESDQVVFKRQIVIGEN